MKLLHEPGGEVVACIDHDAASHLRIRTIRVVAQVAERALDHLLQRFVCFERCLIDATNSLEEGLCQGTEMITRLATASTKVYWRG